MKTLEDRFTQVTPPLVAIALVRAWRALWNTTPSVQSIWLLLSQWALETGWGKSCHWYNLGNAKWSEGYLCTQFACGEELKLADALRHVNDDPEHVLIVRRYTSDGQSMASCKFLPPHRMTWFKAFETLDQAAIYYLGELRRRFNTSWAPLLNGDPAGFAHALKLQGYYTALEHTADHKGYGDTMVSVFNNMHTHVPGFDPVAVESLEHGLSEEDRKRASMMVMLTVETMVNELGHTGADVS